MLMHGLVCGSKSFSLQGAVAFIFEGIGNCIKVNWTFLGGFAIMGLILLQWHLGRGVGLNNTTGFDGAPLTTVDVVNKIFVRRYVI